MKDWKVRVTKGQAPPMAGYRNFIKRVAAQADGLEILNETAEHAAAINARLFSQAEEIVELITGHLTDEVWGTRDVISAVLGFLKRKPTAQIIILTEEPFAEGAALITAIRNAGLIDQVSAYLLPPKVVPELTFHFTVADSSSYRYQIDKNDYGATIQFGEDSEGAKLSEIFDVLRRQAKPIDLSPDNSAKAA